MCNYCVCLVYLCVCVCISLYIVVNCENLSISVARRRYFISIHDMNTDRKARKQQQQSFFSDNLDMRHIGVVTFAHFEFALLSPTWSLVADCLRTCYNEMHLSVKAQWNARFLLNGVCNSFVHDSSITGRACLDRSVIIFSEFNTVRILRQDKKISYKLM